MENWNGSIKSLNSTYAYAEISNKTTGPRFSPLSNLHTTLNHIEVLTNIPLRYGTVSNRPSNHHCTYKLEYKVSMSEYNTLNKFAKK
jgi:hypothetical protein